MIYNPQVGDTVYLCPHADISKFTYYYEKEPIEVPSYEQAISFLRGGGSGVICYVKWMADYGEEIKQAYGSDYALCVKVCVNEKIGKQISNHFPGWMFSLKPHAPVMFREEIPETTRRM
jgi:hypothetical protein